MLRFRFRIHIKHNAVCKAGYGSINSHQKHADCHQDGLPIKFFGCNIRNQIPQPK